MATKEKTSAHRYYTGRGDGEKEIATTDFFFAKDLQNLQQTGVKKDASCAILKCNREEYGDSNGDVERDASALFDMDSAE